MKRSVPVARPLLDEREAEAAGRVILSGWVTQGPEVAGFEREFAGYVGSDYACAVANCTAALHMALMTVGVGPGDEVITVSHSFIATANAVRYCGATPVLIDVEPDTHNIDPKLIEPAVTPRTKAVLVVHQLGMPCDLAAVLAVAEKHDIAVIEDAACAIGSEIRMDGQWERIGRPRGDIACFSFHPRKVITTGDGGMLTTSNSEYDEQFRLLRQHGMSVPDTVRHKTKQVIFEEYVVVGYNYRMTDIQAAVGREQLKRLPDIIRRRRELAALYREQLGRVPAVRLPREPEWARSNWQSFCIGLPDGIDQRQLMQTMLEAGVSTRRGVMCAHREPAYRESASAHTLPNSELVQDRHILLPLYVGMEDEDVRYVVDALADGLGH